MTYKTHLLFMSIIAGYSTIHAMEGKPSEAQIKDQVKQTLTKAQTLYADLIKDQEEEYERLEVQGFTEQDKNATRDVWFHINSRKKTRTSHLSIDEWDYANMWAENSLRIHRVNNPKI